MIFHSDFEGVGFEEDERPLHHDWRKKKGLRGGEN